MSNEPKRLLVGHNTVTDEDGKKYVLLTEADAAQARLRDELTMWREAFEIEHHIRSQAEADNAVLTRQVEQLKEKWRAEAAVGRELLTTKGTVNAYIGQLALIRKLELCADELDNLTGTEAPR